VLRSVTWLTSDTNWDILQGRKKVRERDARSARCCTIRLDRERLLLDLGSDICETG